MRCWRRFARSFRVVRVARRSPQRQRGGRLTPRWRCGLRRARRVRERWAGWHVSLQCQQRPTGGAPAPPNDPSERTAMTSLRIALPLALTVAAAALSIGVAVAEPAVTERARKFLADHEAKFKPLDRRSSEAWWIANVSGKDEDFARKEEAQNAIDAALADPEAFKQVKALKEARGQIDDPVIARCIDVLYLAYLEKQVDPALLKQIVAKANVVEKAFNVYRANVG